MKRLIKALCTISFLVYAMGLTGCANQTATEQISAQTKDPAAIAKAIYLDSLAVYNDALTTYLPYVELVKESNPAAAKMIYDKFMQADAVLQDFKRWSQRGLPGNMDQKNFRALIRDLSIEIAKQIDKGGQ